MGGIILLLLSLDILVWKEVFDGAGKSQMKILFFDVGQGDSIFIESMDGTQVLIDGGPPNMILPNLAAAMSYFDKHIDVVVLTHPHADHVSGLLEVLRRYEVGVVIESGVQYHTAEAQEFRKLLEEKKVKTVFIGKLVDLSFYNSATLKFLHPDRSYTGAVLKNVHDAAVVSELEFEGRKILFMADAEKKLEQKLVDARAVGDVDVLKAGHHGSKTSSQTFFLRAVMPEYAVISLGARNRYGHPHPDILSRLASVGAKIFRTDIDGTIKLEINNGQLKFSEEK